MKYDNCIDCKSRCKHAGKDREFICPGGVSCKVTYTKYVVMPEKCRFYTVDAQNAEMVYRGICSDYSPETPVAIMDTVTGKTVIFKRSINKAGNLLQIRKVATE